MIRTSALLFPAGAVLFVLTLGCGLVRDGGEAYAERRGQTLDAPCGETADFTGRSVLNGLDATYRAPLYYPDRSAMTTVRVRPTYRGGEVRCAPAGTPDGSAASKLSLEIELKVETEDGAFRESIPAVVSGYADSDEFRVSGAISADGLSGSYEPTGEAAGESRLLVEGWLTAETGISEGAIRLIGNSREASTTSTLAKWNRGEHVLIDSHRPCGARPSLTRSALLERLGEDFAGRFEFTARGGRTAADVRLHYDDNQIVCHPPAPGSFGMAAVAADVRVGFVTEEGSFDESLTGTARLLGDGTLEFAGSRQIGQLQGSYRPDGDLPASSRVVVHGSIPAGDRPPSGAVRLETPEGENPLGVPTLGTWSVGPESTFPRRN